MMIEPIKTLVRYEPDPKKRRPTRYCEVCGTATAEFKPYCIEHMEASPHVQRIRREIESVERERRGEAEPKIILEELIWELENRGPSSFKRMERYMQLAPGVLAKMVEMLDEVVYFSFSTKKGSQGIKLA